MPPTKTAPQPSPDRAAAVLLDAWRLGDRNAARSVASEGAVDALFEHPVSSVQARGCQEPLGPTADCAFGVGGTAALLRLHAVSTGPGLWVVDSVRFDA